MKHETTEQHPPKTRLAPLVLSVTEAARVAGISTPEAYRRMKAGQFPLPVRLTDKRRGIRVADLTAWVESLPTVMPDAADHFVVARRAKNAA